MPNRADKILRIGIIQGGKIVEERLVRRRENVTIGSGPKNTFVVPASALPRSFVLFELKGNQYHLAFTEKMDGRVSVGTGVVDFASLKAQKLVKKKGDAYAYPLPESARGKVSLGDVTLLFQFVAPPPEPPKPVLPKEARGGWVKSIDKFFTALLLLSLVAHTSGMYVLYSTPIPKDLTFDRIPDRFAKLIVPEMPKEPPPEAPSEGQGDQKPEEKPKDEPKPSEDQGADEPSEEEVRKRANTKEVRDRAARAGILAVIGVVGDGESAGGNLVADILGDGGGVISDLDEALAGAAGVEVANAGNAGDLQRGLAGGGDGAAADIGNLATKGGGGGKVDSGARKTPRIRGAISSGSIETETSTLDSGTISRYIRSRIKSINSCYEAELKRNPKLRGKLLVRITINTRGMVSDISIEQDTMGSNAVSSCVRNRIRPWRFPVKPEEEVAFSLPLVFAPSG